MGGNADFRQHIHTVPVDVDAGIGGGNALEEAKEQGGTGNVQRLPVAEDHNRQSQEAKACHVAVAGAVGGGQGVDKAAHACQSTGDGGAGIAHLVDIDAQTVCRLRILTAGPEPQTEAGLVEQNGHDEEEQNADIGGKIDLIQEGLSQKADVLALGNAEGGFFQHKPGGGIAGLHIQDVLTVDDPDEEQHHSGSHQVQSRAADGLIRLQVDGGKAQKQAEKRTQGGGHQHGQNLQPLQGQPGALPGGVHEHIQILHGADKEDADERAENHDAFQSQVDDAASLGEHTGQSHNHQRNRVKQSLLNDECHFLAPPFSAFASLAGFAFFFLPSSHMRMTREKALR